MTKYIVDNLSNQSITGQLRIDGALTVTDGTYSTGVYRANLYKTGSLTLTALYGSYTYLIVGETYTINNYVSTDDFSNVGEVISGTMNETSCVFRAIGEIPKEWSNGSELISGGGIIAQVIENTLGYELSWATFSSGIYVASPTLIGPKFDNFSSLTTQTFVGSGFPLDPGYATVKYGLSPASLNAKDDSLGLFVLDQTTGNGLDNYVYNLSVEVRTKKNLDTSPFTISGTINPSFPFPYMSVRLKSGGTTIEEFYTSNATPVNNLSELIIALNDSDETSFLGVYEDDGEGNILLTLPNNLVERFDIYDDFDFEVFQD